MPARDALFWNQVIQTNQFIFSVLRPLIYLTIRQAHFSCLRYTHFSFLYYQYPCQGSQDLVEIKVLAAFVLKREAFTQRIFYQNRQSLLEPDGMSEFILRPLALIFRPTVLDFWTTVSELACER
jgi:hypothetical protein